MDKRHWSEGPMSLSRGGLVQRAVFSRATPVTGEVVSDDERSSSTVVDARGAVLRYVDCYTRGIVAGGTQTEMHAWEEEQEVLFVASGTGQLRVGSEAWDLVPGDAVLLPPGVDHVLAAKESDMELYQVREAVADGGKTGSVPVVRSLRDVKPIVSHWSYLAYPIFGAADGLNALRDILVVRVEPLQVGDDHGHGPGMDEVWTVWQGEAVHIVGQEVCVQGEGVAVSVCPSSGHTLINHTQSPVFLFYFCSIDHNA